MKGDDLEHAVRMFLRCLDTYGVTVKVEGEVRHQPNNDTYWADSTHYFYIGPEDCGGSWLRAMTELVEPDA